MPLARWSPSHPETSDSGTGEASLGAAGSIVLPQDGSRDPALAQPGQGAATSRALVPTALPTPPASPPAARRPCAGFLAQLIACAQQAPQTRARRRAAPDHASATYGAVLSGRHAGPSFRRSV